jgi:uncharacterized membrane protein
MVALRPNRDLLDRYRSLPSDDRLKPRRPLQYGGPGRMVEEAVMGFVQTMEDVATGVELVGVATLVVGLGAALVRAAIALFGGRGGAEAYRIVRTVFGRSILLGLEFLVAADIIRTVAVEPSLQNVGVLGVIVLIRTFLSFSLEVEIDGRWPWRRALGGQTWEPDER